MKNRDQIAPFRHAVMIVVGFALLGLTPTSAGAAAEPEAYVLMLIATFEPHMDAAESGVAELDQAKTGATHAPGTVVATHEGNDIEGKYVFFHAIPFQASTGSPVVVRNPHLDFDQVDGTGENKARPNLPAAGQRICQVETSWKGHEGPVEACTVYKVPYEWFSGQPVVNVSLHFDDASGHREIFHNVTAHALLRMALSGAPIPLTVPAEAGKQPTPMLVENEYFRDVAA